MPIANRRTFLKASAATATAGVATSMAGCLGDDEVSLDFNSPAGEASIQGLIPTWFAEYVDEIDEGLEVETYHGGELGGHGESVDNLQTGALDMYVGGFAIFAGAYPEIQAYVAPYMYDDIDHAIELSDRETNDAVDELLTHMEEEVGVRPLGPAVQGVRRVTTSETPVYEPSDLEPLNLRAVGVPIYLYTLEGMGASTTEVDQPEIPTALATGTVDGQENPYSIIYGDGIWEHQGYIIETNHQITMLPWHISEETYQDLSDTHQDVIQEATEMTREHAIEWLQEEEDDIKETLRDEGLEIIEEDELDLTEWEEQVKPHVRSELDDEVVEMIERFDPDW